MVIAPERRVTRAAHLVAHARENRLDLFQALADAVELAQRDQGVAQLEAKVDRLLERRAALGQVPQHGQRPLEEAGGLGVRVQSERLPAGTLEVVEGHRPEPALLRVLCDALDVLLQAPRRLSHDGVGGPRVQRLPPLPKQARVCHLARHGVLEGVGILGKQRLLVQELRSLQRPHPGFDVPLRHPGHGLQKRPRDVAADHGGALQDALELGLQAIDTRGQQRLDRGRDKARRQRSLRAPLTRVCRAARRTRAGCARSLRGTTDCPRSRRSMPA